MKYLLILFSLLFILLLISLFMLYFSLRRDFSFKPKVKLENENVTPDDFNLSYIGDSSTQERFNKLSDILQIKSDDNLVLKAWFIKNKTHKYMILCHGYTGSHIDSAVTALEYYDNGFNTLCPDARAHGESEGKFRGMGYLERKDIKKWMDYIISMDDKAEIVLYGVSMGAATVMMSMCYYHPSNLKCVVEDCGYGSVWKQFEHVINSTYHICSFPILNIASLLSKLICKYDFKQTSIYEKIQDNEIPCLFIHGDKDDFVPYRFVNELYELDRGSKQKYIVAGASHAFSKVVDPNGYRKVMKNFIDKYISD